MSIPPARIRFRHLVDSRMMREPSPLINAHSATFDNAFIKNLSINGKEPATKEYVDSRSVENLSVNIDDIIVNRIDASLNRIDSDLTGVKERVSTIEGNVSTLQGNVSTAETDIQTLDTSMNIAIQRVDILDASFDLLSGTVDGIGLSLGQAQQEIINVAGSVSTIETDKIYKNDFSDKYIDLRKNCVSFYTEKKSGSKFNGSGFLTRLSKLGIEGTDKPIIVTNRHIAYDISSTDPDNIPTDNSNNFVMLYVGTELRYARVLAIKVDYIADVAICEFEDGWLTQDEQNNIDGFELLDYQQVINNYDVVSSTLKTASNVIVIGNTQGVDEFSFTYGHIREANGGSSTYLSDDVGSFLIASNTGSGNSGSPIILPSENYKVCGILTRQSTSNSDIGVCTHAAILKPLLKKMMESSVIEHIPKYLRLSYFKQTPLTFNFSNIKLFKSHNVNGQFVQYISGDKIQNLETDTDATIANGNVYNVRKVEIGTYNGTFTPRIAYVIGFEYPHLPLVFIHWFINAGEVVKIHYTGATSNINSITTEICSVLDMPTNLRRPN